MSTITNKSRVNIYEVENSGRCEYITYYDCKLKRFKVFKEGRKIAKKYISAPFTGHYNDLTWKYFYEMLNEEETEIAYSYTKRRGFFNYMKENGLIDTFYEAQDRARHEYFAEWEKANGLSIDWNTVTIV